jgi:hypothetical protein
LLHIHSNPLPITHFHLPTYLVHNLPSPEGRAVSAWGASRTVIFSSPYHKCILSQ